MFENVFVKQLYDERRRLIAWGLGAGVLSALIMFLWPSVRDMPDLEEFLSAYPEAMRELFNIEEFITGSGYLNAELFSFLLPALFLIFAISRGASLVAGEEEAGTLELLLVTPASRFRVALQKAAALATSTLALGLVLFIFVWLSGLIVDAELGAWDLAAAILALVFLGVEHGLLAMAMGLLTGRKGLAIAVASTFALTGYVLYIAGELVAEVEPYQLLSPVYHALGGGPVGAGFPAIYLWMPLLGIAFLAVSLPRFERRDIAV